MILIISSANVISGAEYVLADYIKRTKFANRINLVIARDNFSCKEKRKFFNDMPINKIYTTKYLNPVGASKNKFKLIYKFYRLIRANKEISKIIKENKYKYVMGNNTSDMIYSNISYKNKVKHYQYIHDIIETNSIWHKIMKRCDSKIYKYIVVSKAVKRNLINLGIAEEKIELIYNGISYINKNIKDYNYEKIKIGFVGSLIKRKSPESLIKFTEDDAFVVNYVYNLQDNEIISNLCKYNNINLLGKKEREELNDFYQSVDFIVVPSIKDPLPTVILESFSNSTPVIGRAIDGIPEMIIDGYNGFLFEEDSELTSLREKLKNITQDEYIKMCLNANKTILNKFNIDEKVKMLDNLLFN